MFSCGSSKEVFPSFKWERFKKQLKKLKRQDLVHVLEQEIDAEDFHRVLELHGRHDLQIKISKTEMQNHKQFTLKICVNIEEDVNKVKTLLSTAAQFSHEIILFYSLERQFLPIETMISDGVSEDKVVKYEPLGSQFEISQNITVRHIENITFSLTQQIHINSEFSFDLLRFINCHLTERHISAMHDLIKNAERVDLTGSENTPSKAMQPLSNSIMKLKCEKLKVLNLSSCQLSNAHIIHLQPVLNKIEELDLSYNEEMSVAAMKIIGTSVKENARVAAKCGLKKLNIAGCNLTDDHVKQLYQCLPFLTFIDLSINKKLSPVSMQVISDALTECEDSQMNFLRLEHCDLTDEHIENLKECICLLEILELNWNELSVISMKIISSALVTSKYEKKTCSLRCLKLTGCELTDEHLFGLADCIVYLEELHIGYNQNLSSETLKLITNSMVLAHQMGGKIMLKVLNTSGLSFPGDEMRSLIDSGKGSLRVLDLSFSKLRDEHVEKMKESFRFLTELYLCNNPKLTPNSTKIISDSICKRTERSDEIETCHLKVLNLRKCALTDSHIQLLQPCLKYLQILDISTNPHLTPHAMDFIACSLNTSSATSPVALKELVLSSCGLKDGHVVAMEGCYVHLEKLDISLNSLRSFSIQTIKNAFFEAKKNGIDAMLQELNIYQAFLLRDYHYRKFENDMKSFNVKTVTILF